MGLTSTLERPGSVSMIDDSALLTAARAGGRLALEELFSRYRAVAYRVAVRLLGNEADALDALQEGFIKALTHLPTFAGRSSFKTWLLRIVSNAALDFGRQRGRRETWTVTLPSSEAEPVGVWVDPAANLDRADLRRKLDAALAQLPTAQRQTFILHVDGELSYREVADTLDVSIGTVMSRLFYARQKLRELLHDVLPC
jgi:RNA polymerase sigma-70 factor (ECF subfamily)